MAGSLSGVNYSLIIQILSKMRSQAFNQELPLIHSRCGQAAEVALRRLPLCGVVSVITLSLIDSRKEWRVDIMEIEVSRM